MGAGRGNVHEGETVVPKKKTSALSALARHDDARRALDDRGAEIRRAAALELGQTVLDAGGAALSLAEIKAVIAGAVGVPLAAQAAGRATPREASAPVGNGDAAPFDGEDVRHG